VGVLYILDEPSIGLHQRDNRRLLDTLEQLRDMGNTVLVVEHDAETMRTADWIVDLGRELACWAVGSWRRHPGADHAQSPLAHRQVPVGRDGSSVAHGRRRPPNGKWLMVIGARQNNLRDLTVSFPIGVFTCVTGVSGSGKSSLISQTLHPILAQILHRSQEQPGGYDRLEGLEESGVDKVINITQDPIGRTPSPTRPPTSASTPTSATSFPRCRRPRPGLSGGRFSFNVKGGRCEACQGQRPEKESRCTSCPTCG